MALQASLLLRILVEMQVNRFQFASSRYAGTTPQDVVEQLVTLNECDDRAAQTLVERTPEGIHATDQLGNGLLHVAAGLSNSSLAIRALVTVGCHPLATNQRGETALHVAAPHSDGDPEVISELLSAGGLPLGDLTDRQRRTPLDRARQWGSIHVVNRLICDIHVLERCTTWAKDVRHEIWSGLMAPLDNAPLHDIREIVAHLGGGNAIDPRGMPLLIRAADAGRDDVVSWLLENGARPNTVFRSHRTRMVCSALKVALPSPSETRLLHAWGANPNEICCADGNPGSRPCSVLQAAASSAAADSISALLRTQSRKAWHDADLSAALLIALRENTPEVVIALLEYTGTLDTCTMEHNARRIAASGLTGDRELVQLPLALANNAYFNTFVLRDAGRIASARGNADMAPLLANSGMLREARRSKGGANRAVQ